MEIYRKLKKGFWVTRAVSRVLLTILLTVAVVTVQNAASDDALPGNDSMEKRIKAMEAEIEKMREEAKVRKKLAPTRTEQTKKEAEILSAAGREYTLLKKDDLGLEYRFSYSYNSFDIITQITSVEQVVDHSITNTLYAEYGLRDNLAMSTTLPFVYKYDRAGTSDEKSATDIGDIAFGVSYQPFKSGGKYPTTILFGSATVPSGRSPYDIDVNNDLSTGSGAYALSCGASFSKTYDPVVAFGSLFYTYSFPITGLNQNRGSDVLNDVELGSIVSASIGMAFSLSYKVSMNMSYTYSHVFENEYTWRTAGTTRTGSSTRSVLSLGTGWRISPTKNINLKLGMGLTDNDPDFIFSCTIPFNFDLSKKRK